jgi:D-lactate dehydrogenase (cytochrome)
MNALQGAALPTLEHRLVAALGRDAVVTDDTRLRFLAHDVFDRGGLPRLAIRVDSVVALQDAVRLCAAAGVAMVPRGGGASYVDGYLHRPGGHVLFDLGGLDAIEVDVDNGVVTVGAGVTWAALKGRLEGTGLRTPFWGPFSGLAATVGGSMSQNTISHGSGTHGISAQSVLSMDIVLASGELLRTGPSSATRFYGPDLTGLFTGDCGALGIKATIRLPLIAAREDFVALSFAFDDFPSFHAGLRDAAREGLDDGHFAVDLALSQGQIGKQDFRSRLGIARDVYRSARSPWAGIAQLLRMAKAGDKALRSGAYMAHFIVEGVDAVDAEAKARRLRRIVGGREVANTVPGFVRAVPFAPLTNILGPRGERWFALHGLLTHDAVAGFHAALAAFFAERADDMARLGVWTGGMYMGVGSTAFLYELAIYWPDALTDFHRTVLATDHLATVPSHPAAPEARAWIDTFKRDLIALFAAHDAAHFQVARTYPYRERLDASADALLVALKRSLDPANLMNPGALGL